MKHVMFTQFTFYSTSQNHFFTPCWILYQPVKIRSLLTQYINNIRLNEAEIQAMKVTLDIYFFFRVMPMKDIRQT